MNTKTSNDAVTSNVTPADPPTTKELLDRVEFEHPLPHVDRTGYGMQGITGSRRAGPLSQGVRRLGKFIREKLEIFGIKPDFDEE